MPIRVDSNGLYLEGRRLPLYSGSLHYWRHSQEIWPALLERVKSLGFEMIQTPVPWGVHESGPGIFDFGERFPNKNLPRFLDLCREAGLSVILSLGPFIDEDLAYGGFPLRVIKNPAIWAQTSAGAPALSSRTQPPFPIPSYASERLYAEAGRFFDALLPIVRPHLHPDGTIVLCQINKETAFFGRRTAYDLDYSPDSIALYRRFLTEKYTTVEGLNEVYGTRLNSITEIQPPHNFDAVVQRDLPWYLDWAAYKEYLIRHGSRRFLQLLRERGLGAAYALAGPADIVSPIDFFEMQTALETPLVGLEVEPAPQEYPRMATQFRYLAGTRRLPWISTFGSGGSWSAPHCATPAEEEFAYLTAFMHGVSGVNFHMLVEGDRWVGAPVGADGALREPYADLFRRLSAFVNKYAVWDSKKMTRVLIVLSCDLERYRRAFSALNHAYLGLLHVPAGFSDILSKLGFQTDPARLSIHEESNWLADAMRFLELAQVEYNFSDTHAPLDDFYQYDMVFLPTADFMDPREQEKLMEFAGRGGHLVFGPDLPTLDQRMTPASPLGVHISAPGTQPYGNGKISFLPAIDPESTKDLLAEIIPNSILLDNPNLRLTLREGIATLVYVANPTASPQRSLMISSSPLRGAWNAPEETQAGSVTAELAPYSVQVWEVVK